MKIRFKIFSFYLFSIGFFLLKFDWVTYVIECSCNDDLLPKYYAFPFIYKCESLGSSMAEVFFISGILLNASIITILLVLIDFCLLKMLINRKIVLKIYSIIKIFLLVCSLCSFLVSYSFLSSGDFYEWKSDFKEKEKNYKPKCKNYFKGILLS